MATALHGRRQVPEVVEAEPGAHVAVVGDELDDAASVGERERPGELRATSPDSTPGTARWARKASVPGTS